MLLIICSTAHTAAAMALRVSPAAPEVRGSRGAMAVTAETSHSPDHLHLKKVRSVSRLPAEWSVKGVRAVKAVQVGSAETEEADQRSAQVEELALPGHRELLVRADPTANLGIMAR